MNTTILPPDAPTLRILTADDVDRPTQPEINIPEQSNSTERAFDEIERVKLVYACTDGTAGIFRAFENAKVKARASGLIPMDPNGITSAHLEAVSRTLPRLRLSGIVWDDDLLRDEGELQAFLASYVDFPNACRCWKNDRFEKCKVPTVGSDEILPIINSGKYRGGIPVGLVIAAAVHFGHAIWCPQGRTHPLIGTPRGHFEVLKRGTIHAALPEHERIKSSSSVWTVSEGDHSDVPPESA